VKLTIDKFGRIVLPKAIRMRLGLSAGTLIEATESAGGLLLRPLTQRPSLIKVDGILVHTGKAPRGLRKS
jgi:AbrB family looped-hinge helix DNA binding protein